MPLIQPDVLIGIADRVAYQYKLLKDAVEEGQYGQDYHTRINDTGDIDLQIPLLAPYLSMDKSYNINTLIQNFSCLRTIISNMDRHFSDMGIVGSWDGYLHAHDLRVSDYFNQVYRSNGMGSLLATNVFCEDILTFATINVRQGSIEYVDGEDFGPGMNPNLHADGRNFAAQQLGLFSDEPIGADIDLMVSLKDWQGDVFDIAVSMPAGTTEMPIGTVDEKFLDVVTVKLVDDGGTGQEGDTIKIKNIKEREISL